MNNDHQPKALSTSNHSSPATAYWNSVHRCTVSGDGTTEILHTNGLVERYDSSGRPIGLRRVRGTIAAMCAATGAVKRGDLKPLPFYKMTPGPSVIRADGMWKIIYRDGFIEHHAATRQFSDFSGSEADCHGPKAPRQALAA